MSAAPNEPTPVAPAPPAANPPSPQVPAPPAPEARPGPASRAFLAVSAVLFFGWLAWLSLTALTKSREPIVSRVQAAVATVPVVAEVDADDKGTPSANVKVVEALKPNGPAKDAPLAVGNLPSARGFTGKGKYLLLLAVEPNAFLPDGRPAFQLVGSRGASADPDPPVIYPWSPDIEAQARRMFRAKD